MKIKYLGTAAAEAIPAMFCECETCKKAKEIGGKNIRSRTQALINDDLLIDYPCDSYYHFVLNKIDISKIRNIVITHSHEDHFYPSDFEYFNTAFSHPDKCLPFCICGSKDIFKPLKNILENENNPGLVYKCLIPYRTYDVGNYKVTPLRATHSTKNPFIYIISDGKKNVFYCHDTGLFKGEVYKYLVNNKIYFDLISLDCTEGNRKIDYPDHMNLERNRIVVNSLKKIGCIDNKTKIVLNHFSHNGTSILYDDLTKLVKVDGFIISYDGLELEI